MLENESLPRRTSLKPFASWILFCTDACTGDTRFYLSPTNLHNVNTTAVVLHQRKTRNGRPATEFVLDAIQDEQETDGVKAIAIITAAVQSLYNLCWPPFGITTAVHANLASAFLRLFNLASPAILRRLFPRCRPLHELTQRITTHSHFLCLTPFLTKAPSLNDTWFTHICHTLFVIPRL